MEHISDAIVYKLFFLQVYFIAVNKFFPSTLGESMTVLSATVVIGFTVDRWIRMRKNKNHNP